MLNDFSTNSIFCIKSSILHQELSIQNVDVQCFYGIAMGYIISSVNKDFTCPSHSDFTLGILTSLGA